MANYNGDLVEGLDSENDSKIQQLSHEVMLIQDQILDLDDEKDKGLIKRLEADCERINFIIDSLRRQGR